MTLGPPPASAPGAYGAQPPGGVSAPAGQGGTDPSADAVATRPDGGFFRSLTLPEGVSTTDLRAAAAKLNLNLADGAPHLPRAQLPRAAPAVHPPVVAQAAPAASARSSRVQITAKFGWNFIVVLASQFGIFKNRKHLIRFAVAPEIESPPMYTVAK